MSGEVLRRMSRTRLSWDDPKHFDRSGSGSVPCRCGDGPTRMRDEQKLPCHLWCAEEERAAQIASERFGDLSPQGLAQELAGHATEVRR